MSKSHHREAGDYPPMQIRAPPSSLRTYEQLLCRRMMHEHQATPLRVRERIQ